MVRVCVCMCVCRVWFLSRMVKSLTLIMFLAYLFFEGPDTKLIIHPEIEILETGHKRQKQK